MFLDSEAHSVQFPSLKKYLDTINMLPSEPLGGVGDLLGLLPVSCTSYALQLYSHFQFHELKALDTFGEDSARIKPLIVKQRAK